MRSNRALGPRGLNRRSNSNSPNGTRLTRDDHDRRADILNLEAPRTRIDELADYNNHRVRVIDAQRIRNERTRLELQRDVFATPFIGSLLRKIMNFKLNTRYEYIGVRDTEWLRLNNMLTQLGNLIDGQEEELRRNMTREGFERLVDLLNTAKEQLRRMFENNTSFYYHLNNDIANANNIRLRDGVSTNAEIFATNLQRFMHREITLNLNVNNFDGDNDDDNIDGLPGNNMRVRPTYENRDILQTLSQEYNDNITFVNRLLSYRQFEMLRDRRLDNQGRNETYARLGQYFRILLDRDPMHWSVNIDVTDHFTRTRIIAEIMYRLYNSIRRFHIAQPRKKREPFMISIQLADQQRIVNYPINHFTINHILAEIRNRFFDPVMNGDNEQYGGSDIATTVVANIEMARRVTFGPMKRLLAEQSPGFRENNQRIIPLEAVYFTNPLSTLQRRRGNILPYTTEEIINSVPRISTNTFRRTLNAYGRTRRTLVQRSPEEEDRLRNGNFRIEHPLPTYAPMYGDYPMDFDYTSYNHQPRRPPPNDDDNDEISGSFFPFFNISGYNLERYQIPARITDLKLGGMCDDCCFLYALKQCKDCPIETIREMAQKIITKTLIPKWSPNLFNEYNLKIIIKRLNPRYIDYRIAKARNQGEEFERVVAGKFKQKYTVETFGEGTIEVKMCNVANHYFIDERVPFTNFSFKRRHEWRDHYIFRPSDGQNAITQGLSRDHETGIRYMPSDLYFRIDKQCPNGYRSANLYDNKHRCHFMMSSDLVSELYIEYLIDNTKNFSPMYYSDVSHYSCPAFKNLQKNRRNIELNNELNELHRTGKLTFGKMWELQSRETRTLFYDYKTCTKLKTAVKKYQKKDGDKNADKDETKRDIFYADFETCVSDSEGNFLDCHQPFMCCISKADDDAPILTFTGFDCGEQVLDYIIQESIFPLVYFHNLSYDINFLMKYGIYSVINRNSTILQGEILYRGVSIKFKDSYGLLPMKLKNIALSFKLPVQKEIFPYYFYSPERVEEALFENKKYSLERDIYPLEHRLEKWEPKQMEEMRENIINDLKEDPNYFDIIKYCEFYCGKDVEVLKKALNLFHDQLYTNFQIDCHQVLSISSIANKFLENKIYLPNKHLFYYSNHIRDFLLEAVHGGRVMCARNERHHFVAKNRESGLVDFDAVSLYPSAMSKLYIVEGTPKVLTPKMCNYNFLQSDFITAYVVEIFITEIKKPRDFPLVIHKDPKTGKIINTNQAPVRMVVCDIELRDLVEFQDINFIILRGLYWTGPKDKKVRDVVKNLFKTRAELKKQKNSLENTYKLLMNSIYGKTIQKAVDYKYRFLNLEHTNEYQPRTNILGTVYCNLQSFCNWYLEHSEYIREIVQIKDSNILRLKEISPISKHFNNTLFGVQILAMSKHLMNRVMCLADDLNLDIYYQDTDSMHIRKDQLPILQEAFMQKYNKELIGTNLCQFHPDFDPIAKDSDPNSVVAVESYFLGKKMYIDKLMDDKNNVGYHIRMKGVSNPSILDKSKTDPEFDGDVMKIYEKLYHGENITFDLCAGGGVKFENDKLGEVKSKTQFLRCTKATCGHGEKPLHQIHEEQEQENHQRDDFEVELIADLVCDYGN